MVELHADGSADFNMKVCLNWELERVLLGFGDGIIVKTPRILVKRLKEHIENAYRNYTAEEEK